MVMYDINIRGRIYGSLICLQCRRPGFDPWVEKIPWRREWQDTPIFLRGESPWTEGPGGLQSMGLQGIGHNWATKHSTYGSFLYYHWKSSANLELLQSRKFKEMQGPQVLVGKFQTPSVLWHGRKDPELAECVQKIQTEMMRFTTHRSI